MVVLTVTTGLRGLRTKIPVFRLDIVESQV